MEPLSGNTGRRLPLPPGGGGLCAVCGLPTGRAHDVFSFRPHPFEERPSLWSSGWVDLRALGVPEAATHGWREVREGPVAGPMLGGLGMCGFRAERGPWVRHEIDEATTAERVSAAAVLLVAGRPVEHAVAAATTMPSGDLDGVVRPAKLVVETPRCGAGHRVEIVRGVARQRCEKRVKQRYRTAPPLAVFRSSGTCSSVERAWRGGDIGTVRLDTTRPLGDLYERVGHDGAVTAAMQVMVVAMVCRLRRDLLRVGEFDRFLVLDGAPAPADVPATLCASTRDLPAALLEAHPTWLWSDEPPGLAGFKSIDVLG